MALPEIVDVGGLSGSLALQNPLEKVGRSPPPLPEGFAVGGGRVDPSNSTISGPEALLRNLK